jgi:hypothetical protein
VGLVTGYCVLLYHAQADSVIVISMQEAPPGSARSPNTRVDKRSGSIYYRSAIGTAYRYSMASHNTTQLPYGDDFIVPRNSSNVIMWSHKDSMATLVESNGSFVSRMKLPMNNRVYSCYELSGHVYIVGMQVSSAVSGYSETGFYLVDFDRNIVNELCRAGGYSPIVDAAWSDERKPPPPIEADTLK